MRKHIKMRLLVATVLILLVAFIAITIPFWVGHHRSEMRMGSQPYFGVWEYLNERELTFLGMLWMFFGAFGIPACLAFTIFGIVEELKE